MCSCLLKGRLQLSYDNTFLASIISQKICHVSLLTPFCVAKNNDSEEKWIKLKKKNVSLRIWQMIMLKVL